MSVRDDPKGLEAAARAIRTQLPPGPAFIPPQPVLSTIEFCETSIAAYFDNLDTEALVKAGAQAVLDRVRERLGLGPIDLNDAEDPGHYRGLAVTVLTAIGLLPTGRPER
jgi:hypothetical protein